MDQDQSQAKESSPKATRTLPNGAEQDTKTGRIVAPAPGSLFDSRTAREAAAKRKAKIQEKTRVGIQAAVKKNKKVNIEDFEGAHEVVGETLMDEVVLNNEKDDHGKAVVQGKARADTYAILLRMEGTMEKSLAPLDLPGAAGGGSITMGPEAARYLIDTLAGVMERRLQQDRENMIEVVDA